MVCTLSTRSALSTAELSCSYMCQIALHANAVATSSAAPNITDHARVDTAQKRLPQSRQRHGLQTRLGVHRIHQPSQGTSIVPVPAEIDRLLLAA